MGKGIREAGKGEGSGIKTIKKKIIKNKEYETSIYLSMNLDSK